MSLKEKRCISGFDKVYSSIEIHLPSILLGVKVDNGPKDHELGAATFEQGHLVLLAHPAEGRDLLRHLDDPLDGQVRQVDHAVQVAGLVCLQREEAT